MSIVAEFTIEAEQFLLGRVLRAGGGMNIEIERVVPASKQVMPYVWVSGGDRTAFEEAVRATDEVRELLHLDTIGERSLYRIGWDETVESLIYGMVETNATILEAHGRDNWLFRIRFNDHESLSAFSEYCQIHDIRLNVRRVHNLTADEVDDDPFDLTDEQREAIELALQKGYFEVPRQATLSDLAVDLDVSQQAISERLRRGTQKVMDVVVDDTFRASER
ncbi:helix-turn-helix domain-containing protein [Salinigranum halophilum]|jgi:predicted DNA binding protein|uniref:helix-turn-helix domain-containing protein n=1 Tax=Salinigranum halophilum TaxID=2565931 RepID=UPI0010A8A616|nr:helix-turn-helix domain-containing protein [Salinigranum halophilum]